MKIFHKNTNQNKSSTAIFVSDKAKFGTRKVIWDGVTLHNNKVFHYPRRYNDQITDYIRGIIKLYKANSGSKAFL